MNSLGHVGRYELIRSIGAGGMGEVFLAHDRRLGRKVAIKRVRGIGDAAAQRRILHEAQALAHLSHPNIAPVFDVVEDDKGLHIVMEFVAGQSLASQAGRGPATEAWVVDIGLQVADALIYAHAQDVVHRDIKPSNLMVTTEGLVKVLDFGLARFEAPSDSGPRSTTSGLVRGTPPYMAPEVLFGFPATVTSDIYSLGITLFELASGRRPFDGRDVAEVLRSSASPAVQLSDIISGFSPEMSRIVARAIAADPTQRFQSARDFKSALSGSTAGRHERETTTIVREIPWRKTWLALIALLLLSAVLLVGLLTTRGAPTSNAARSVLGVMVFNDTGDSRNDYLAVGLTDVIISRLASTPGLAVVPRTAVLPYLENAAQVAKGMRELGLTHALTVGVQKSDSALHLTAGIMNASDGSLLWTSALDGTIGHVFQLQQRVADAALRGLRAEGVISSAALGQARTTPPTLDEEAFASYANGRSLIERPEVPGNLDRAIGFLEHAIERDRRFARAYAAMGEAAWLQYRSRRDAAWVDRARAATLEALRIDPDDPSVRMSLAIIDHGTGRLDEAVADLEKVLQVQPAADDAYRLLGRIHSERGDFDRAIDVFREAERIRPSYPATVRALGLAYYDGGRLSDAIASFTRLTMLQPENGQTFQLLGTAQQAAGDLDGALKAYERANQLAPRAPAYSNIGVIHHTRQRYELAVGAYQKAIELQPKEATTHRNLADALWMTGKRIEAEAEYETAIALAREALAINPSQARVLALVAFCEAKLGRIDAARASLREALALAPSDSEVVYKQAVIEVLAGQRQDALKTLARAVQLGYSQARFDADRDLDRLRPLPLLVAPH